MSEVTPPSSTLTKILIVDDDSRTLAALRRALAKEPYEVTTAEEPRIALRWLLNQEVSLVISDRRMPEMVGDRFLCQIRRRSPRTALVLLTAYPEAAPSPPFVTMLAKPWDDAALRETIRHVLRERDEAFGPVPGEGDVPPS